MNHRWHRMRISQSKYLDALESQLHTLDQAALHFLSCPVCRDSKDETGLCALGQNHYAEFLTARKQTLQLLGPETVSDNLEKIKAQRSQKSS